MTQKPEDFDFLGSNTTLWSHTFERPHHMDCDIDVRFTFTDGYIHLSQECRCGAIDRKDQLEPDRVEALQDQLYNWVAWRQV